MTLPQALPAPPATPPIPLEVSQHLLWKAKQQFHHLMHNRNGRALWTCSFTAAGLGADVSLELRPELVLAVRNRVTGEILAQSQPVEFGPHDPSCQSLDDRLRAWRDSRLALTAGLQLTTQGSAA